MTSKRAAKMRMGKRGSRRAAAERARVKAPGGGSGRGGSGGGGSGRGGSGRGASPWRRWFKRLALGGALAALVAGLFVAVAVGFAAQSIPSFNQLKASQSGQTIVVRARDGSELVELGPAFGEWLSYREIPTSMKNAMVAVEDRRFWYHFGIDPIRLTGAILEWAKGDKRLGGTSTISQQLARNLFLNNNRTFDRKLREAILALALEWKFSKQQILELYLNKVYFGGGAYGIDSASRNFFSHPARQLSTAEAAIIAGLVKAPSRYAPSADVEAAVNRARVVLRLMREQGYISPDEANVDVAAVKLKPQRTQNSARYFTDWALPQLDLLLPETFEPVEVWTTIDVGMQRAAATAIKANTPAGAQGALVSLDRDGAILAMVGGTDYVQSSYNRATEALRQPGSAWKLFVYLAALEAGYTPDDRVNDVPVEIDGWRPRNSNGRFLGETNLRTAFALSINSVAAQLGNEVGFGTIAAMARRFGITTPISTYPSMVLGTNEVRLIEMTRAFGAISNRGQSIEPFGITRVTTASGELLYRREPPRSVALVPDYVVAGMTDLLQAAVATGTGRAAQIGRPVAGKTGTTSSNKDGWFIGFSSGITTGVWMGRDDARPVRGLQGGRAPASAFAAYMRYAVKDRPVEPFVTEMKLPDWAIEPDDEYLYGDPQDYYFIDEQGNLVEPGRPVEEPAREPAFDVEGEQFPIGEPPPTPRPSDNRSTPQGRARVPEQPAPRGASEDFLRRATGGAAPTPPPAPQGGARRPPSPSGPQPRN